MIDSTRRSAWQIIARLNAAETAEADLHARVQRGTAHLDRHNPDWWRLFDERDVILRSVLHISGPWTTIRNRVGLPYLRPGQRYDRGFEVYATGLTPDELYEAQFALAQAWAELIEQRRGGAL